MHAIRIIPGPSSMWFDARGRRLPGPLYPGFDTLGTLATSRTGPRAHLVRAHPEDHREGVRASGSEQNPDTTSQQQGAPVLKERLGSGPPSPVQAFMDHGEDFIVERTLPELVRRMNALTGEELIDLAALEAQIVARDRELANPYAKDGRSPRSTAPAPTAPTRITRVAAPHRILDPEAGPLIAVRLHILTRKSLGGLQTDLDSRVLRPSGEPLPGLYAAGEVAGFGGGGGARLPRARGHVPRRLHLLGAHRGPRRGRGDVLGATHRTSVEWGLDPSLDSRGQEILHACSSSDCSGFRSRTGSSLGSRSSSWAAGLLPLADAEADAATKPTRSSRTRTRRSTGPVVAGADEAKASCRRSSTSCADPKRFQALGRQRPKGIMLHGPPGTGKTLLAKAVAKESGAKFYAQSASSFVEMFAGLGAAPHPAAVPDGPRQPPAIIFIDEIDAVGGERGSDNNSEREQTLNQLLVEMDGFARPATSS
jgi:hypothetical protein